MRGARALAFTLKASKNQKIFKNFNHKGEKSNKFFVNNLFFPFLLRLRGLFFFKILVILMLAKG
jgi:hypothetical protein